MSFSNKYQIGDIVALNSHPLFREHSKILEFPAIVPPLMIVKEIFFEDEKKKKIFSEEFGKDYKISDVVKYICTFFSANKSEFMDVFVYESFIKHYLELKYYRENHEKRTFEIDNQLLAEVEEYEQIKKYEFGNVIQFKTKKLEHRKSYDLNNERIANNSFLSPDFILTGIKKEITTDLFYHNGSPKKIVSDQLFKVLWFNQVHQKNSEQFLPKEFFVKNIPF